ncbi:MAG: hypothetical protein J6A30_09370 [Ruminococcus sp.]|nr:hypothetical protein [Ruminococcus sp.]
MKKVINHKVYDTETAKKYGEYEPNPYRSDFHWFCESLYQKKTGEFFLYGDGNAASPYSKSCGQNEWCGTEIIRPLTYEEAQKWAEKHLDGDEYIRIFGDPEENSEKIALNLYIRKDTAEKLKQAAAKAGITVSEYIEGLI